MNRLSRKTLFPIDSEHIKSTQHIKSMQPIRFSFYYCLPNSKPFTLAGDERGGGGKGPSSSGKACRETVSTSRYPLAVHFMLNVAELEADTKQEKILSRIIELASAGRYLSSAQCIYDWKALVLLLLFLR